ncbi:MAG: hypothetical protein JWR24_487 [Actinoallomurus sp.]|jgi:hypothetical protein|nr:hypothetical protein [Actinoallomurus sp.]
MAAVSIACTSGLLLTGARAGQTTEFGAGSAYANRSKVFGLVDAGETATGVLFAPARKVQPGGPETVRPAAVGRYAPLPLAPGVVIRASAPIANDGVTDYVRGVRLTPEQLTELLRKLRQRLHPLLDRAHMFELWFDGRGRIIRMQHYFSP